jgi:hypothetical protein
LARHVGRVLRPFGSIASQHQHARVRGRDAAHENRASSAEPDLNACAFWPAYSADTGPVMIFDKACEAYHDPDYMKTIASKGETMDVTEGSKLTPDLQLIVNDDDSPARTFLTRSHSLRASSTMWRSFAVIFLRHR